MLIHSVYFWLTPNADATLVAEFQAGLERLAAIPDVAGLQVGRPGNTPKREVVDDSYSWALIVTLKDQKAHDRYQAHRIHEEFARQFSSIWARVRVYDVDVGG